MATDFPQLANNKSVPVNPQERTRSESDLSHDDKDNLVVSLYHHLIQICHIYLRAINCAERDPDGEFKCKQEGESPEIAEQHAHETQAIVTTDNVIKKSNRAAGSPPDQVDRDKNESMSIFADAVARLVLWGDVIHAERGATLSHVSRGLYHNALELLHSCGKDLQDLRSTLDIKFMSDIEVIESLLALDTWLMKTTHVLYDSTDSLENAKSSYQAQIPGNLIGNAKLLAQSQLEIVKSFEESVSMLMDLAPTIEDVLALQVFLDAEERVAVADLTVTNAANTVLTKVPPELPSDDETYSTVSKAGMKPASYRHSHLADGPWTAEMDKTLIENQRRYKWDQIAEKFFDNKKTGNACRKRYARLITERKEPSRWDQERVQKVIDAYNQEGMREMLWRTLAEATNEKWQDVEQLCYGQGFRGMIGAHRHMHARRTSQATSHKSQASIDAPIGAIEAYDDDHTFDSGIGAEYQTGHQFLHIPPAGYASQPGTGVDRETEITRIPGQILLIEPTS